MNENQPISCFFLLKHFVKNWKPALVGSLAVLLNPFLLEYAFEARPYMLFAFLCVTATLFYLKRRYFISSIFLALAILAHNFAVFFFVAFLAFWFYENRGKLRKGATQFGLGFTLPILVFLGWLRFLWNQWVKVAEGFWIEPKTSAIFVDAFRKFFQGSLDYPSRGMLYNLALALVFMGFSYWMIKASKDKDFLKNENLLLLFLLAIPFLFVYVISSFWVPIFHERFLIPILPLFIILVAHLLYRFSKTTTPSNLVIALSTAYLLFAVQSSEEILRKTTKPAINWGVKQALEQARPGDVIMPEDVLNFLETKYYVKKSGSDIPVLAYAPEGKVVFYIGSVLLEEKDVVSEHPKNKRVWVMTPDGGYYLKED